MNKATLVGVWPSEYQEHTMDDEDMIYYEERLSIIDRVLDTMGGDVTLIVTEHALGHITDESFRILMDYLSKYDAMLRGEV